MKSCYSNELKKKSVGTSGAQEKVSKYFLVDLKKKSHGKVFGRGPKQKLREEEEGAKFEVPLLVDSLSTVRFDKKATHLICKNLYLKLIK